MAGVCISWDLLGSWDLLSSSGFQTAGLSWKVWGKISDVCEIASAINDSSSSESSEVAKLGDGSGYAESGYGKLPKGFAGFMAG